MRKLFLILFPFLAITACSANERAVPGWGHGVVLCDAKCIIINLGHENDPEVAQLLKLATTCQLNK